MGSEFTFYNYVDADGSGADVIRDWLNGEGKEAKAWFAVMIPHLEASPPPGSKGSFWQPRYAKVLKNKKGEKWGGFLELRKRGKVQYRILGQMQGRNVFLVATGIHKGQNYKTDVLPATASMRVDQMIKNPATYRRKHRHDKQA